MWDLINVNDCEALTLGQLESGMATVTRYDLLRKLDLAFNNVKPKDRYFVLD